MSEIRIPEKLFFRIGEVANLLRVKPHVLRYWETEFPVLSPDKSSTGQRVYRRADVEMLVAIRRLLYVEKYSIEGARKRLGTLRKQGGIRKAGRIEALRGIARELDELADKPISSLFRF